MQKLIFTIIFTASLLSTCANAQNTNGKAIFDSKNCGLCHKKDLDNIGPSLKTISKAYSSKQKELMSYLQSNSAPIIAPKRAAVMNPQLAKIKTLSEKDIKDLTIYFISISDRPN